MKSILFVVLLVSSLMASCQTHWDKASAWTLYSYQGRRIFRLPIDSLERYDNLYLNQDTMASLIKSSKIADTQAAHIWMGGYAATCKIDGTIRKVDISNYGGYFFDERTGVYYQLPPEKIEAWQTFLKDSYRTLVTKNRN